MTDDERSEDYQVGYVDGALAATHLCRRWVEANHPDELADFLAWVAQD